MKHRIAFLAAALLASGPAWAAAKHVGAFESWNVFTTKDHGKTVCYMAAHPAESKGGPARRGDVMVVISHYPADKAFDEVAVHSGFAIKESQDSEVLIGGTTFKLFYKDGASWNRDASGDRAMVQSMKSGTAMTVKAIPSSGGKLAEDTYSLKGFTAAHDALDKACGR